MLINNQLFLIKDSEVPKVPIEFSEEARLWWKEQKKRCIEGYVVGGKWMPPTLYFYINFWKILLTKGNSKTKTIARPFLRDIEWEFFTAWALARGFSGFNTLLLPQEFSTEEKIKWMWNLPHTNFDYPQYENQAKDLMLMGPREFGKASWSKSITYTKEGRKTWGEIKIGDEIYGPDGKLTKVLKVFEQGKQPLYKVTLRDGRSTYCTKEHLWGVWTKNDNKKTRKVKGNSIYKVLSLEDIYKNYIINRKTSIKNPNGFEPKYFIPNNEAIEFSKKETIIDPYTLGLLLGDGCFISSSRNLAHMAMLKEDFDNIKQFIPYETYTINSSNLTHRIKIDNVTDKLLFLNLKDKYSHNKFIPTNYLFSTIEDRINILQGLLDTDGTVGIQKSQIEYCTVSEQLCKDVMFLCRSLGINCSLSTKELHTGNTAYRVNIFTEKEIFKLKRKQDRINKSSTLAQSRINKTAIVNIELAFEDDCRCVLLDNESHLYLIDDFIPTHNSYMVAGGVVGHEWLFNGAKRYFERSDPQYENLTTNIVVGAGDTKYSTLILEKFKLGYDSLMREGIEFGTRFYPHPFSQEYSGSLAAGKKIIAEREKKIGGTWRDVGTKSAINHVAYKNNVYAAQGSRNSVMVDEEIGMFDHYEEVKQANKETMVAGTNKFGSSIGIGTGGAMEKGTLGAYKMYYSPVSHDILDFEDRWEKKGKIGMFIPGTKRANEFKDDQGNTDEEKATKWLLSERTRIKAGKNSKNALHSHIQYNPLVPSEIFLRSTGNIFPINDLLGRLAELETNSIFKNAEYIGNLLINPEGRIYWKADDTLKPIYDYPLTSDEDEDGAVVIYEMPYEEQGEVPYNRYIAGNDPYDQSKSAFSQSLGSLFIYDRYTKRIVAEYTGRPQTYRDYYETARRLLKFYNARCLYENERKGFFDFLVNTNETFLLVDQPSIIDDVIKNSKVERGKGMHMTDGLKIFGEELIKTWLLEPAEDIEAPELLNLHKIRSIPLLKELIAYNEDDNFDRVMALMMVMYHLQEIRKIRIEETLIKTPRIQDSSFFKRTLFKKTNSFTNEHTTGWR
jgi:hypothetical protein